MPEVHPTAIVEGRVELADDVAVGPHCVLDGQAGPITIAGGTRLIGNAYLTGPLTLGANNTIYPFACLGFSPQDLKWDPSRPGAGVVIGEGNTFRECATVHRATSDDTPTTIGSNNYFMTSSHAGHDARVGDRCTLTSGALLGGFAIVDDRATLGGGAVVHQFCRVGRGAMLSGVAGLSVDLPPFFMLTGTNVAGSVNVVGLRRSGMPAEDIENVRWAYRVLCRNGLSAKSALAVLHERSERPIIREYIEFVENSKRGICSGRPKAIRGTA